MDRAERSEAIIQEVGALFMAAVQEAATELPSADLDGIARRWQALSRQVFGPVLAQVVAVRAGPPRERPRERPPGPACGGLLRLVDRARPRQVHGLVGDATVQRPTSVCTRWGQGQAPLDTALALGQGALTPALARVACRAGRETSFGEASDLLDETLGVAVPSDAMRRVTARVGAGAETEQQGAIAQAQQGPVQPAAAGAALLVVEVEVDGVQVHLDEAGPEMKVGRVAPLGPALQTDPRGPHLLAPGARGLLCRPGGGRSVLVPRVRAGVPARLGADDAPRGGAGRRGRVDLEARRAGRGAPRCAGDRDRGHEPRV